MSTVRPKRMLGIMPYALAVLVAGCDKTRSPSAPTPTAQPPAATIPVPPADVRVASIDQTARTAVIQWTASQGAESYVVEYGPVEAVTRFTVATDGPQPSITLRDLPSDALSLRVRARNGTGVSEPSNPAVALQIVALADIIEALFFGSGPYGTGFTDVPGLLDYFPRRFEGGEHTHAGTMLGWRSGTIPVRVEHDLPPVLFNNLVRGLAQVADLTGGEIRPGVVERTARMPDGFQPGEVRVMVREQLVGFCSAALGCTLQSMAGGGQIDAAIIQLKAQITPDVVTHEVGHALLGLHHLSKIQWPPVPVMGGPGPMADAGFIPVEVEAIRKVYAAGLRHGATRADFVARGLINR